MSRRREAACPAAIRRMAAPSAHGADGGRAGTAGYALLRSDPSSHGAADPARSTPAQGRISSLSG